MPYTATSADGYVGLFFVPEAGVVVAHVDPAQSSIQVEERVLAAGTGVISVAHITLTLEVSVGTITSVVFDKKRAATRATNTLYFPKNPGRTWFTELDGDTIIVERGLTTETYTFKNTPSHDYHVQIPPTSVHNRIIALMENLRDKINTGPAQSVLCTAKLIGPTAMRFTAADSYVGTAGNTIKIISSETFIKRKTEYFSGGVAADASWSHAATCQVSSEALGANWVAGSSYTKEFAIPGIAFSPDGIEWTFRARFFNADLQVALEKDAPYNIAEEQDTESFNGISDLDEYAEVTNLKCSSALNEEGGGGNNAYTTLVSNNVMLTWDDMTQAHDVLSIHPLGRTITNSHIFPAYSGIYCNPTGGIITAEDVTTSGVQLHKIMIDRTTLACLSNYAVFIYTSSGVASRLDPVRNWPTDNEPNGDWVFFGSTLSNSVSVPLIQNKYVSFWVGFGTPNTLDLGGTEMPWETAELGID